MVRPTTLLELWRVVEACVANDAVLIMQASNTSLTNGATPDGDDYDRPVVVVSHPDGRRSSLEPVVGSVGVGDAVTRGHVVGTVADVATHCAPRRCVHWGVRAGESYLDPMSLLPIHGPVVLLPLD